MRKPAPYRKYVITRKNEFTEVKEWLLWVDDNVYVWVSQEEFERGCFTTFFEELGNQTIKKLGMGKLEVWEE